MPPPAPRLVIFGQLRREYILPPTGKPRLNAPGGNAIYAAAGAATWESGIGIVARVGEDFPKIWLDRISDSGFDLKGVRVLPGDLDLRTFIAYSEDLTPRDDNPVALFAARGLTFPVELLGYHSPGNRLDSLNRLNIYSLRQIDLPKDFLHGTFAHFCPIDFLTHTMLPAVLRQSGFTYLTLDPGASYMDPTFWKNIPSVLTGLTAFMPSEEELRALFHGRSTELWEMAEALGAYGCDLVVVKCGERGQMLYESASRRRWEFPAYPVSVVDPTGAGDAFCGGFLAGLYQTFDPIKAVLHGSVAASVALEGSGPLFSLDVLPGLPSARLEVLQDAYREV
ncbi:MAG TPA: carbohydrate kinase family protein [Anaerolineales bacterium]|nr:carbohydrate kinase family protein [Anaerolineales bacterium]